MNAEEYMMQYIKCRQKIERLSDDIAILEADSQHVTASWEGDRVQASHSPDRLGQMVAKISDMREELITSIGNAVELMNEIEAVIEQVEDVTYQTVLHKRYIACKKWEVIGEEMHYDPRWAWELNQRALAEVDKIIN